MNRTYPLALAFSLALFALPVAAQEKSAGEHVDDTWIHTKVKSALTVKQGASINIEVYKGEVQLAGFTGDADAKKRLPEAAARVSGVKKVYNQIIVVDSGRTAGEHLDDGVLVTAVEAALADAEPTSFSAKVNTEVNKGRVLLSGFIDSEAERAEILKIAKGVKGVKEIIDGMNVKSDA